MEAGHVVRLDFDGAFVSAEQKDLMLQYADTLQGRFDFHGTVMPARRKSSRSGPGLQSTVAWGLAKLLASRLFPHSDFFDGLTFQTCGKPLHRDFWFSLSHTTSCCAVVMAKKVPVGVDVEQADRCLPEKTIHTCDVLPDPSIPVSGWAAKEAVIKAAGNSGVDNLEEVQLYGRCARYRNQDWQLALLPSGSNSVCLVASSVPIRLVLEPVTLFELIKPEP